MIYRYVWKVSPKLHTISRTGQLNTSYLPRQLLEMGGLGAICQQIRTEAFDEYFHHVQAYLRWDFCGSGSKLIDNKYYLSVILASALLLAHLRHVSVYWTTGLKFDRFAVSFVEALNWLQCLKQLKTLEVVISTPLKQRRLGKHRVVPTV